MEHTPFLSVIMPVYNAGAYLKNAVQSLLVQTFSDMEILCINDCSKDNSLQILQQLAQMDDRIVVINSPENVGAGAARNLGLAKARGEYITFMDADDVIQPELYEKAVVLVKQNDVDYITWGLTEAYYDKNDHPVRSVPVCPARQVCKTPETCMQAILELERTTLFGYQWNSLYRGSIVRENGIMFEKSLFYEDFFFNLAFAKHIQSLATLEDAGYIYYKRVNGSITNRFSKDYYDLSYRRVSDMFAFYTQRECVDGTVYNVLGDKLLRYTLSAICRNFDPRSGMDFAARKAWFFAVCQRPLYRQILPHCRPSHPVYAVLKYAIDHKNCRLALLLGEVVRRFM